MTDADYINAPGTTFDARDLLRQIGLPVIDSTRNLEIARKRVLSDDVNDRTFGLQALWALASLGNQGATTSYVTAIEKHLAEAELPEALALHYEAVAAHWREISRTQFDLATAMAAMSSAKADADKEPFDFTAETPVGCVVVSNIGDPHSAEGKSLLSRYSRLIGRPLPRSGNLPAEGEVAKAIAKHFPWAARTSDIIERSIGLIRDTHSDKSFTKPLIFVGEPGTGKTSLAMFVAEMLGRHHVRLPAAGTMDSGTLAATPRGWSNFRASLPVQAMLSSKTCDPCIIVDEIDKSSKVGMQNGSVMGALMGMLDKPECYYDTALMADADLSNVLFMATANSLEQIEEALLDRFTVVPVPRPGLEHYDVILGGLRMDMAKRLDVHVETLPQLDGDEYGALRNFFSSNRGSLRKLSTAYEIALKSALKRNREVTLM